jgi:putative ABC transport system permease protein
MDLFWLDLRQALRTLRRDARFSALLLLTLAVGIGANTAVFSLVHSTLLKPLPYPEPHRLAMLWTDIPAQGVHDARSAYANIEDWKAQNRVFDDLATFDPTSLTLTGGEWPEQISTARVSANLFSVLGVAPDIGRAFTVEEEQQRAPVVVLSHDLWQERFSGSREAVGRTIEIAGQPFQVVGVMPRDLGFPERGTRLWLPQTLFTDWDAVVTRRGTAEWRVVGRLRSDVSLERAREDMNVIAAGLERMHPGANAGLGVNVVPLYEHVTGYSFRLALWALYGAVAFVLLIACANAAHLVLARGMDRSQELAVRQALGATTPRLIRQGLTENLLISLASGIAGLILARWGLRVLIAVSPADLPRLNEIGMDGTVLIYAVVVSLAAGALFGAVPVLSMSRGSVFDVLRQGRGPGQSRRRHRVRNTLIVFQFALAMVLVFGANLLIRSFVEARSVDIGFVSDNVLMANLSVASPDRRAAFYEQVTQDVQSIAGVTAAGIVEDLFISGAPNRPILIEHRGADRATFEEIRIDAVAGRFFEAVGVPLRQGRAFAPADRAGSAPVAIINETMARRFWPGESPIGRRFRTGDPEADAPWLEIVGVVADMYRQGFERAPIPQVFRPYAQAPSRNMNLLVRSETPPAALTPAIRARIADIDRAVPLYHVTTVSQALDGYLVQRRFQTFLLGLFSTIALVLAAIGIYGLMAYSVARRTHEMGVRVALGARSQRLIFMILRQGIALAMVGLAAGMLCALWVSDAISALLFGVDVSDPTNIVVSSGVLLITALIACYIPARRAARVDPMTALR